MTEKSIEDLNKELNMLKHNYFCAKKDYDLNISLAKANKENYQCLSIHIKDIERKIKKLLKKKA